jgi:hypothetical protein
MNNRTPDIELRERESGQTTVVLRKTFRKRILIHAKRRGLTPRQYVSEIIKRGLHADFLKSFDEGLIKTCLVERLTDSGWG